MAKEPRETVQRSTPQPPPAPDDALRSEPAERSSRRQEKDPHPRPREPEPVTDCENCENEARAVDGYGNICKECGAFLT